MKEALGRPTCWRCRRVRALCWCEEVRPVPLGWRLVILMHPKEAKLTIGTGRLVHHAVADSVLWVGEQFDDDPRVTRLLSDPAVAPVLMFPRPSALDLTTCSAESVRYMFPADRRPLVIVPDGTWTTAKKLVRKSRCLGALPAIRYSPRDPPRYDPIRKEPRRECRSTLEAVHALVDHLDALGIAPAPPDRAHDHLLVLLERLVTQQSAFAPADAGRAERGLRASERHCS